MKRFIHENKDLLWAVGSVVLLHIILLAIAAQYYNAQCEAVWERSGMQYEWGILQGCMIQRKDGTWIPATMLRETEN